MSRRYPSLRVPLGAVFPFMLMSVDRIYAVSVLIIYGVCGTVLPDTDQFNCASKASFGCHGRCLDWTKGNCPCEW